MNTWWGYLHVNQSIQVKRFFSDSDIHEARESDFVLAVTWPFGAVDREDALRQAKIILK